MKFFIYIILPLLILLGVSTYASGEDIDWDKLVECVIEAESGGNPTAHNSSSDAHGLMQVTPICLYEYNRDNYTFIHIQDLFEPNLNKAIGTWYLKKLHTYYICDTIPKMLAAYNGGITRLRNYNWDISMMPRETQQYVVKVMKLYKEAE